MGKISCLHIADVHLGHNRSRSVEDFYSTICRDLKDKNQKIDLIICTGDLIDGKSEKTKELSLKVSVFFHNLLDRINKDKLYAHKELSVIDVLSSPKFKFSKLNSLIHSESCSESSFSPIQEFKPTNTTFSSL